MPNAVINLMSNFSQKNRNTQQKYPKIRLSHKSKNCDLWSPLIVFGGPFGFGNYMESIFICDSIRGVWLTVFGSC